LRIEPMRILLIADFYWPYLGGVEQHVRTLGRALAERGHQVTVATLARADLPTDETDGAVRVRRITSTTQRLPWLFASTERPWAPPLADPAVTLQLRRLITEVQPHIVHGHDWLARSFLPLRRWSRRTFGTRFVSTMHYYTLSCARKNLMRVDGTGAGGEEPCTGPGIGKCLACATRHYGFLTGPITYATNVVGAATERRRADALIAVSAATAIGNGLHPAQIDVVPNFLPPTTPLNGEAETWLNQLPAGDFILFVGDLRPMKGLDVLLRAHASLRRRLPLVLIGKTWPDTPPVPANVTLLDRWPNAAVLAAWQRCAIGVVPSVWAEPFGIVVIEAMSGGCAVVASAVGGIPEIVDDGVNGVLVPGGDPAALATALQALIDDPTRRTELGAAARQRAARYRAEVVVSEIEAVYQRAASGARPASTSL
jgi:glycosyltransferase involved in cell wall biosynthesis